MKTKTKKCGVFAALAVALLLSVALVTSCVESLGFGGLTVSSSEKEVTPFVPPPGMGYIRLNIIDPDKPRTVLPAMPAAVQFYSVVVTGTGASVGSDFTSSGGTSAVYSPVVVPPGTYSVTVYAYSSIDNTVRVAKGTTASDVTVTTTPGATANVTLKKITDDGTGTFKYTLTLPTLADEPDTAVLNVTTWPDENATVTALTAVNLLDPLTDGTTGVTLDSGFYYVTVALTKAGHASYTKLEIVHIAQNLTTTFNHVFNALNRNLYTVTYNNVTNEGTNFADPTKVVHGSLVTNYYTTPPVDGSASGSTFGGWCKDNPPTAPWLWASDRIIKDLNLYAKWVAGEDLVINVTGMSITEAGFTLDPPSVEFYHSQLGTTAASAKIVLTNAAALGATAIKWKIDGNALTTTTTSAGPTPVPVTNDTLNLTFAADTTNVGLLVIGEFDITVEATIGGEPYLATLHVEIGDVAP